MPRGVGTDGTTCVDAGGVGDELVAGATGAGNGLRRAFGTGVTGTGVTGSGGAPRGPPGTTGATGAGSTLRGVAPNGATGAGKAVRGPAGATCAGNTFLGTTGAVAGRSLRGDCASVRSGATGSTAGWRVTSDGVNG